MLTALVIFIYHITKHIRKEEITALFFFFTYNFQQRFEREFSKNAADQDAIISSHMHPYLHDSQFYLFLLTSFLKCNVVPGAAALN